MGSGRADIRGGDFVEQPLDDILGAHALGLGLEIGADTMAQHRNGDFANVVDGDRESAVHGGECLAAVNQELPRPRPGAPIDQLAHEVGGPIALGPRGPHQPRHILDDVLANRDRAHQFLQVQDRAAGEHLANFGLFVARGGRKDRLFLEGRGVVDLDVEHEPVELRFGQRIGAFLLDWVLGCDRKERLWQGISRLTNRDFSLLHGLQ